MSWIISAIMIASFMFGYWIIYTNAKQRKEKASRTEGILNGIIFSFGWFVIWLAMALS